MFRIKFSFRKEMIKIIVSIWIMILLPVYVWSQTTPESKAPVTVISVLGEVQSLAAGEIKWASVSVGTKLAQGTKLTSGEGASAMLEFEPGHRAQIGEKTTIQLSQLEYKSQGEVENTVLDLTVGRILNNVKKLRTKDSEYSIRTPTATAAVRGTVYEVEYDEVNKRTSVTVLEGIIELEDRLGRRLSITLEEREKAGVDSRGEVSPSETISPEKAQEMQQSSQKLESTQKAEAEGEDKTGQLDAIQSDVMKRIDEIDERQTDELRATRFQKIDAEDDDD